MGPGGVAHRLALVAGAHSRAHWHRVDDRGRPGRGTAGAGELAAGHQEVRGVVAAAVGTGRDGSYPVHRPPGGAVLPGPLRPAFSVVPPALGSRSAGCPDLATSNTRSGAAGAGSQHQRGGDPPCCAPPLPPQVNTSQGRPPLRQALLGARLAANRAAVEVPACAGIPPGESGGKGAWRPMLGFANSMEVMSCTPKSESQRSSFSFSHWACSPLLNGCPPSSFSPRQEVHSC